MAVMDVVEEELIEKKEEILQEKFISTF